MRTLLISTVLLFFVLPLSAQSNGKTIIVKPKYLDLNFKSLPFKKIIIIDSRFDTSKLGYLKHGKHFDTLKTHSTLANNIEQSLTKSFGAYFDSTSTETVYLFIKHLWLQQTTLEEESERKLNFGLKSYTTPFSRCKAYFECYLQRDSSFFPLLRFDSSIQSTRLLSKVADELLAESFQVTIEKLAALDLSKKRKAMSWQEVLAFNQRFFRFPKIEKESLRKGVYLSFSDFLQNKVIETPFEVTFGNLTDELYLVENGEKRLLREFWGYCDGNKQFISQSMNLFEIERVGQAYEYVGFKGMIDALNPAKAGPVSGSSPADVLTAGLMAVASSINEVSSISRRLQINMETGKPY